MTACTYFRSVITMCITFLMCITISAQTNSNFTAIRSSNMQIKASLNNSPLAFATDHLEITLNKQTGAFEALLFLDDLYMATAPASYQGVAAENKGKPLKLTCTLPIDDVLTNTNNAIDRKTNMMVTFNDLQYHTDFTFTILGMQTGGFSVMSSGVISLSALNIFNPSGMEDEVNVLLSFTGF
jgi:hypothetical protein